MAPPRIPIEQRFWPKVNKDGAIPEYRPGLGPCWEWTAAQQGDGYGVIGRGGGGNGHIAAHRVAYELLVGPIPDDLELDHLCRVRHCVNPEHLEPVTRRENLLRGPDTIVAVGVRKTRCVHGHPYTEANTRITSHGTRRCRTCDTERSSRAYARRRKNKT